MSSPFPGMDPYLEAHWRDVHARLIIYTSDALQTYLPRSLRARVEERVVLDAPMSQDVEGRYPDVRVVEYASKDNPETQASGGVAVAEPLVLDLGPEEHTETFLEIIDASSGNRVVTIIEFLSPTNKIPGPNREQYLRKQNEVCSSDVNLVEIDLIRSGVHSLAFPLQQLKLRARTPYMACIRRPTRPAKAELYLMGLSQRLPIIRIPMRPQDADVPLDLQALVDQCYRNGGYEGTINYAEAPEPTLSGALKVWVEKHLGEKGLQSRKKSPRSKNGKRDRKN